MKSFNILLIALHGASRALQYAHDKAVEAHQLELALVLYDAGATVAAAVGKLVVAEATKQARGQADAEVTS